ncbi:diguanylate cyclase [Bacillus lacus]|uniref:Diguanylate cyclase n=1 Tax=Metabacillus lacus TaxID=1983721 RepID=A0A7X2J0E8_9BACI|nr:histidine kinase N-terminal 7TM domain-containing protein [Metabacillus lacus]MRX73046.1 diguanylate cyclase [Metabacillus lacus]
MMEDGWIYLLLIGVAGILSLVLSLFSHFALKDAPGARQYAMAALCSAVFSFAYLFELNSSSLIEVKFWLGIEYLVMPFIPGFILWMCIDYAAVKLGKKSLFLLFGLPVLTVFLHHTNDLHNLYYTSIKLKEGVPFEVAEFTYGPFFFFHALYLFLCLIISMVILLFQLAGSTLRFRVQISFMIAGLFLPIAANQYYLNDSSPYGIDLGPVSMSISFVFHALSLFSYRMFHVLPIAREKVFDSMNEGVMVLDHKGALVDYNKALKKVIPHVTSSSIGSTISHVMKQNRLLLDIIGGGRDSDFELEPDGVTKHYQVTFSSVFKKHTTIIGSIITFTDITDRVILQKKLARLAAYDGLTQIYNRTHFLEKAETALISLMKKESSAALILFDIDHFKLVNDTYGHQMGDTVITHVIQKAQACLQPQDLIGRYGGEEFIIFLHEAKEEEAIAAAESIRSSIEESLLSSESYKLHVTSSFGVSAVSCHSVSPGEAIKEAVEHADHALYAAKRAGRNNVQLFEESELYSV